MAYDIKGGGQSQVFDYKQVDEQMAEFLRMKTVSIKKKEERIVGDLIEIGRDLYEAQQELASNYRGVFEKWYTSIGYERQNVYNLINRYKLVLAECENIHSVEVVEAMPVTVLREITRKDAESTPAKAQAKKEVLSGEITTGKEYHARIKELELKAEQAEQEAEIQRKITERLAQEKEQAEQDAQSAREELERALEEANPFSEEPYGVKLGLAMYDAFEELSKWQKEYSWIITDATEFQKLVEADPNFAREFSRLDKFWQQMSAAFNGVRSKGTYREESETAEIIDVEFTEVI